MKLLVVDWDYFFPNPMAAGGDPPEDWGLYDWQHRENPFMSQEIWSIRGAGFLFHDRELPVVKDYQGFWDRFTFRDDAMVLYGDSNLHGMSLNPYPIVEDAVEGEPWEKVTLFDAHHDCGYGGTYEEWVENDTVTCENWMLCHYQKGSKLEVIHPPWRVQVEGIEPEPVVPVERRIDTGGPVDDVFDAVYICRSGAWVPSWCDDQFTAFVDELGAHEDIGMVVEHPFNEWNHPRPDALEEARKQAAMMKMKMPDVAK